VHYLQSLKSLVHDPPDPPDSNTAWAFNPTSRSNSSKISQSIEPSLHAVRQPPLPSIDVAMASYNKLKEQLNQSMQVRYFDFNIYIFHIYNLDKLHDHFFFSFTQTNNDTGDVNCTRQDMGLELSGFELDESDSFIAAMLSQTEIGEHAYESRDKSDVSFAISVGGSGANNMHKI